VLEIFDPDLENTNETLEEYENSGETLWEVLIFSHFSSSEKPKEKWLTFKSFSKSFLSWKLCYASSDTSRCFQNESQDSHENT